MTQPSQDDSTLAERVGLILRSHRRAQNKTLAEAAKAAMVSTSYLSAVETGRNLPSLQVLGRLTESLGTSIQSVLEGEGRPLVDSDSTPTEPGVVRSTNQMFHLSTAVARYEPGFSGEAPLDLDAKDVFLFVKEGEIDLEVDGETYSLGPCDAADLAQPGNVRIGTSDGAVVVWSTSPRHLHD